MLKLQQKNEKLETEDKYNQIIEYLKQDDGYWINNDKWDFTEKCFYGKHIGASRYITFSSFKKETIKNEFKYFVLKSFKEKLEAETVILNRSYRFKNIGEFLDKTYKNIGSIWDITNRNDLLIKWNSFLINDTKIEKHSSMHFCSMTLDIIYKFLHEYYEDRDEIQKDVWNIKNIKGARISASVKTGRLSFQDIPDYYRNDIKRYFATIITRKSYYTCSEYLSTIKFFFKMFYENGYKDGFLENLSRNDVEKYLYWLGNELVTKNATYRSKFVTYVENVLNYMQIAEYSTAPKIEICKLFYHDDIPKRERNSDSINRVKYIPAPILEQIDNNIDSIKDKEIVDIYKLLRETGWRGTDILNLRYHNCLEQIWNEKENKYNYYLCGEITKTGIAELKIPIHEEIAHMVENRMNIAKGKSTNINNPKQYLFNIYVGKHKGRPTSRVQIVSNIQKLIEEKNILDSSGEIYHFKLHSLRHTRAKEYIEQGIGIEIVQQMLGHRSLQMTVHYATVSENILYEKWKATEKLQLFKLNKDTKEFEEIDINDDEKMIRFEYVKNNLDAVKVPFGICFKSQKVQCRTRITQCLECASFCTTIENIEEYETEISRVKKQIEIAENTGRADWIEKNKERLELLERFLERVKKEKVIHKNENSREGR